MAAVSSDGYTKEERARYGAAYERLWKIIDSSETPDAEKLRRALGKELASGFPINYSLPTYGGWTLLHYAVNMKERIKAGLPQILIEAGADVNVQDDDGATPLGIACWWYVRDGEPEYLTAIDVLLTAGARPELDESYESWKEGWEKPEQLARRDWLKAYIAAWNECHAARDRGEDAAPAFDYAL